MEEEIDLVDMVKYFWNKKLWIILIGIVFIVLAILYTKFLVIPEYTATAAFILTNDNLETEADVYSYAKLPDRYFAIIDSKTILDKVVANLKINDINDIMTFKEQSIEINNYPTNFLITVSVTTDNAKEAASIANEMVRVSIEEIKNIYKDDKLQVLDYAVENWNPVNVDYFKNVIMFVIIAEVIVCGYIMIRYMFVENSNKKEVEDANKE